MKIEKAGGKDIKLLTDLRIAYLKEDHGILSEQEEEAIAKGLPAYYESHLGRDLFCWLAYEENEIVSCAFLLVSEKPMSPAFINGKTGTVLNVYTKPAYRHQGYARAIINELLEDARKMELCTVELKATDAGYSLYCEAGFADEVQYHPMKWKNPAFFD